MFFKKKNLQSFSVPETSEDMCTDYEGKCGNCHSIMGKDDMYCKICGTKAGKGKFLPYEDIMECIYGPMPIEREHLCKKCKYSWTTVLMVDDEKYCPKCGGKAPVVRQEDYFK